MAMLEAMAAAVIVGVGALGIVDPDFFMKLVRDFQAPAMTFAAAAIRVAIGAALVAGASASRWPVFVRLTGGMILIGGLVTPFDGALLGRTLLALWPDWGPAVVRAWGVFLALLGVLVMFSVLAPRKA